jgi:hypothetical protein
VSEISLGLWFVGIVLIALAVFNIRLPLARRREMDQLAENAKRYESWRGGSRTAAGANEKSSTDVMRDMLRRQIYWWLGVGGIGLLLLIGGFFIR